MPGEIDQDTLKVILDTVQLIESDSQLREIEAYARACRDRPSSETDEEIEARLRERFEILALLTEACQQGIVRAMIGSGPAGVGKSWTVEQKLLEIDETETIFTVTKGRVAATGVFKLLYAHRLEGQVAVFDDCDSLFFDETSLNLMKSVCDTTRRRRVTWGTEWVPISDDGEPIPKTFDFEGGVIFLTNYDLDTMVDKGHKLSPHLSAMLSRSHYVDLSMRSKRDCLVRIKQVIREGMLKRLSDEERLDVERFIDRNADMLRELSLRIAIKVADLRAAHPREWERIARVTCLRG
jgi:hypothetical protein